MIYGKFAYYPVPFISWGGGTGGGHGVPPLQTIEAGESRFAGLSLSNVNVDLAIPGSCFLPLAKFGGDAGQTRSQ